MNAWPAIIKKAINQNLKLLWLPQKVSWEQATIKSTIPLKTSKPTIWGKLNVFCKTCYRKIETSYAKTQRTMKKRYQFWHYNCNKKHRNSPNSISHLVICKVKKIITQMYHLLAHIMKQSSTTKMSNSLKIRK